MRMIMIKEKELDDLVETLKLHISDKVRNITQFDSKTDVKSAVDQMERSIIYNLCRMVEKIKET